MEKRQVAVTLRLSRHGQKKRPFYRIVATEQSSRRDGRFIEIVGTYNPMVDPPAVVLKEDLIRKWVDQGAQTSRKVRDLIIKGVPGLIEGKEKSRRERIQAKRKARKDRQKATAA